MSSILIMYAPGKSKYVRASVNVEQRNIGRHHFLASVGYLQTESDDAAGFMKGVGIRNTEDWQ